MNTPSSTRPSVLDPVAHALDWTRRVLFQPFDPVKWLVLGFCAWLAWLGHGGGNGGSANWRPDRDEARDRLDGVEDWVVAHLVLVITIAAILICVVLVLWVLFTWLSSRGKFMFLDGVVNNRAAVVEPWHRFRTPANSLFLFRIVLSVAALVVIGTLVAMMVLSILALGLDRHDPGAAAIAIVVFWVAVILGCAFAIALVAMAVNDFIVPIMWLRGCRVMSAWSEFVSLLSANLGIFVLYVLIKIALAVVIITISCVATCVTCCIVALPYVGTVLLLPLFVFRRSYSIHFLGQFGPDYATLTPAVAPPPAPVVPDSPPSPAAD